MALGQHLLAVLTQRNHGHGGKVYSPSGLRRLRFVEPKAASHLVERVSNMQNRAGKVNVAPLEPQKFALAEPRGHCQNVERVEAVLTRSREQGVDLLWIQDLHVWPWRPQTRHSIADVPGN